MNVNSRTSADRTPYARTISATTLASARRVSSEILLTVASTSTNVNYLILVHQAPSAEMSLEVENATVHRDSLAIPTMALAKTWTNVPEITHAVETRNVPTWKEVSNAPAHQDSLVIQWLSVQVFIFVISRTMYIRPWYIHFRRNKHVKTDFLVPLLLYIESLTQHSRIENQFFGII